MAEFRKKPVVVEAMQWTGDNQREFLDWGALFAPLDPEDAEDDPDCTAQLWVAANSRWLPMKTGEWVIQDSLGFYPCSAEMFAQTYEPTSRPSGPRGRDVRPNDELGDIEALKAWAISHSTIPEMSDVFRLCERFDALLEANAQLLGLESSLQIRVAELEAENAQLRSPASNPTWPNGERRRGYPAYEALPADPSAPVPQKP